MALGGLTESADGLKMDGHLHVIGRFSKAGGLRKWAVFENVRSSKMDGPGI